MGTIKTTNIEPIADNGTVTLGSSGDTFTLGSGVKQSNLMYPAFHAFLSASTNPADNVITKTQCDTVVLDTDNCYDNTTNYRFTPTVAGKYFVYTQARCSASSSANLINAYSYIYRNGNNKIYNDNNYTGNQITVNCPVASGIVDMNGTTDYLEAYHRINTASGSGMSLSGNTAISRTFFGAYRIGS